MLLRVNRRERPGTTKVVRVDRVFSIREENSDFRFGGTYFLRPTCVNNSNNKIAGRVGGWAMVMLCDRRLLANFFMDAGFQQGARSAGCPRLAKAVWECTNKIPHPFHAPPPPLPPSLIPGSLLPVPQMTDRWRSQCDVQR